MADGVLYCSRYILEYCVLMGWRDHCALWSPVFSKSPTSRKLVFATLACTTFLEPGSKRSFVRYYHESFLAVNFCGGNLISPLLLSSFFVANVPITPSTTAPIASRIISGANQINLRLPILLSFHDLLVSAPGRFSSSFV